MTRICLPSSLLLVATLLAGCSGNSATDGPQTLKFNVQPGTKFNYTMQTVSNIDAQGTQLSQDMTMGNTYAVQAGAGTSKELSVTIDRMAMQMAVGGQKFSFDSQQPAAGGANGAANPLAMLGRLVGKSYSATLSDQGQVTAVKGLDEIKQTLTDPNDPNAAANSQQLEGMLNEESMKSSMSQSFNIYPDKPVKPGDTWVKDATIDAGGMKMSTKTTYKLTSVSNGVAHLGVDGKVDASGQAPLSGTQTGTMDVDVATGMLLNGKITQNLTGQAGGPAMKVSTNINITGKKL